MPTTSNFLTGRTEVTITAPTKGIGHGRTCAPNFDHRVLDTAKDAMQETWAIQAAEEEEAELVEEVELQEEDIVEPRPTF
jgi:hypothetical protein